MVAATTRCRRGVHARPDLKQVGAGHQALGHSFGGGGGGRSASLHRASSRSNSTLALVLCLQRSSSMYVCMVITYSRVWINRVRLPILLMVS